MDMDWDNPMAMFGMPAEPLARQQSHGDVVDDENDDDFYGEQTHPHTQHPHPHPHPHPHADAQPGASAEHITQVAPVQNAPAPPPPPAVGTLSPQQKAHNEKQLQLLKAKLLAKRQNTPSRPASTTAQVGTPTPAPPQLQPESAPVATTNVTETKQEEEGEIVDGMSGIDALLDQGQAMAEARSAAELANSAVQPTPNGLANQQVQGEHSVQQGKQPLSLPEPTPRVAQPPQRTANLSDEYYADLPAWLDMTGYHSVDFRNSKLSVYKQRRELERQAADIAEQIEKIKQKEQETMMELRTGSTPIATTNVSAPPLPRTMPTPQTNGIKRGRSPDLFGSEKARRQEHGGFRIGGANESPTDARPSVRRFSRSPPGLDRRISYPDARRRSVDERSRDPSLERRQSYYRRDGESGPPRFDHYAPPSPRDAPRPKYPAGPGRLACHSDSSYHNPSIPPALIDPVYHWLRPAGIHDNNHNHNNSDIQAHANAQNLIQSRRTEQPAIHLQTPGRTQIDNRFRGMQSDIHYNSFQPGSSFHAPALPATAPALGLAPGMAETVGEAEEAYEDVGDAEIDLHEDWEETEQEDSDG
ncbi:hypothetical protein DOTSEDRAFT_52853 [Dothistroma septosporum NZE10]|uniref:Uncharacterized protein n=1 Tax=Dothistroma septosporum (strain NZE10 / CBS 128990) TaxID=675120 RepID=N1PQH0_DOTSN|nr:hypothetical protein DOTSEDRAFT_52853 [Dothistroma septosporum NZE10]